CKKIHPWMFVYYTHIRAVGFIRANIAVSHKKFFSRKVIGHFLLKGIKFICRKRNIYIAPPYAISGNIVFYYKFIFWRTPRKFSGIYGKCAGTRLYALFLF